MILVPGCQGEHVIAEGSLSCCNRLVRSRQQFSASSARRPFNRSMTEKLTIYIQPLVPDGRCSGPSMAASSLHQHKRC
jgi:hypothetical protein